MKDPPHNNESKSQLYEKYNLLFRFINSQFIDFMQLTYTAVGLAKYGQLIAK